MEGGSYGYDRLILDPPFGLLIIVVIIVPADLSTQSNIALIGPVSLARYSGNVRGTDYAAYPFWWCHLTEQAPSLRYIDDSVQRHTLLCLGSAVGSWFYHDEPVLLHTEHLL